MSADDMDHSPPSKRQKLDSSSEDIHELAERPAAIAPDSSPKTESIDSSGKVTSLARSITPPKLKSRSVRATNTTVETAEHDYQSVGIEKDNLGGAQDGPKLQSSPIQLSYIRDLPAANNVDAVKLRDILGDPLIKECWQFNYLFDLDFLMSVIHVF